MKTKILILLFIIGIYNYSHANIVITNGLTHRLKTEKGQTYRGKIEVQNIGKVKKNVKLYLQDVSYDADGTTRYTEPGTNKMTNSNWLKFNTNFIELGPGEKSDFLYELVIPNSATENGTYWSVCMVEPVEEIMPNENNNSIQINSIVRYAIQIIADNATQNLNSELKFKQINVDKSNDLKVLKIALANEGKIYCLANIDLEIFNKSDGAKIEGEFNSSKMSLLPNTSKTFLINISTLKSGQYKVIAFAKDDQENVFALEFELDV